MNGLPFLVVGSGVSSRVSSFNEFLEGVLPTHNGPFLQILKGDRVPKRMNEDVRGGIIDERWMSDADDFLMAQSGLVYCKTIMLV